MGQRSGRVEEAQPKVRKVRLLAMLAPPPGEMEIPPDLCCVVSHTYHKENIETCATGVGRWVE